MYNGYNEFNHNGDCTGITMGQDQFGNTRIFGDNSPNVYYNTYHNYFYKNSVIEECADEIYKKGNDNMSLAIIYKNDYGIVLLTDSRITTLTNKTKYLKTDEGEKIYFLKDLNIGITCVGVQEYNGKTWIEYIQKIEQASCTSHEFILNFWDFIVAHQHIDFQFFVAIPDEKKAFMTNFNDDNLHLLHNGTSYQGETDLIKPIINHKGYYHGNSLIEAAKYYADISKDVINLGNYLKNEIGRYNSVGGKIRTLILPYDGESHFLDESELI